LDEAPANEADGEMMESLEDVGAPFLTDSNPAVAGEPGWNSAWKSAPVLGVISVD
jgi:hypothetical protein